MKIKYVKYFFIVFILLVCFTWIESKQIYANNNENNHEYIPIEKSEDYIRWENLSDEERKNAIEPSFNNISTIQSMRRSTYNK